MDAHLEALGRRAVACPGWRWMAGMRSILPMAPGVTGEALRVVTLAAGVTPGEPDSALVVCDNDYRSQRAEWVAMGVLGVPDLSDPATVGCLLALVRESHRAPDACSRCRPAEEGYDNDEWEVRYPLRWGDRLIGAGFSEVGALVVALEVAPEPP